MSDSDQELKDRLLENQFDNSDEQRKKKRQIIGIEEEEKFELQDLSVRNRQSVEGGQNFKRSSTMLMGLAPQDQINPFSQTRRSQNNAISQKQGFPLVRAMSEHSNISQKAMLKKEKKLKKLKCKIIMYNCIENFLLFAILLLSVIYANLGSAIYFVITLILTAFSMSKSEAKVKLKFALSILIIIISFLILICKNTFIIILHTEQPLTLSEDDALLYNTFGVYVDKTTTKITSKNVFWTIFFDCLVLVFSILITATYASHKKDVQLVYKEDDENTQYILHPFFEKHQEKLCVVALVCLTIETIFVQTIFQAFILILLIILLALWAYNLYEKSSLRFLVLAFSQGILMVQLILTFVFQIAIVNYEITNSDFSMACDMFGLLLHNIKTYSVQNISHKDLQVILHLVSITLCLQAISVYKSTRISSFKNLGFIPQIGPEDDQGKKSNEMMKTIDRKKFDRGRTIGSGGIKGGSSAKTSIVNRFREKTLGLKQKLHDESSIHEVAQRYYKDFSPQIWLWVCRFTSFLWCYGYHDIQSWIVLMWIMHSTLFKETKRFVHITITYYLPAFVIFFLFYYAINIPRVVEFQRLSDEIDGWRTFGFYQFSLPFLEVFLMILFLLPFFFLIKSKKYLDFNKEDQSKKFLEKLTHKDSPTFYYFVFMLLNNLDLIVFITIFFSGVNKIDFYHVFLMFFFVSFILWPRWFKRNYVLLLYYVDFFVFEKYLYTLIIHYISLDSFFVNLANVLGLATEYDEYQNNKYFRYPPKFQQWLLIIVVFLQYQLYQLFQDDSMVKKYSQSASGNFKKRYPRLFHFWELLQHLKKEFLILLSFVVFFMIIIFSAKSIINWGFQIIICIFIITYVGVGNDAPPETGLKRLQRVWFLIIWYASIVLVLQITYQFAALPFVRQALNLDAILDLLPTWIRRNLGIIGFQVYSKYIWQKFLIYLMYFAIGVYVKKQMIKWNIQQQKILASQGEINVSRNSDMQEDYFQDKRNLNWKQEYLKIRFTTPYLVYKLRKLWVIIDKLSQILFVIISVMIMVLSNYWQISLSMAIHLTCFIGLCLVIASKLYQNRKREKKVLNNKNPDGTRFVKQLIIEDCTMHWTKYKRVVNEHQVKIRQRVWFFQFAITLLCIAFIYPTEFLYSLRQTFFDQKEIDIVNIFDYLIFYLFWGGVYHSPEEKSGHGYFYNVYGYLIILILLIFEKNAQQWALNRFECSTERVQYFREIEENLKKKPVKKVPIAEQIIEEDEENEEDDDSIVSPRKNKFVFDDDDKEEEIKQQSKSRSRRSITIEEENKLRKSHVSSSSMRSQQDSRSEHPSIQIDDDQKSEYGQHDENNEDELKEELRKWIMKRYKLKVLNGVKILLEDSIQLLLLISSVYKDSIIGLILLFGVFIYMTRRKIRTMSRLAWIVGLCMILQYGLALSNLTSKNNPMDFPFPFNPYPSDEDPEGRFFIPWYLKIPLLKDSVQWAMYLGMGISNTKLNGLWIDYFIMGCIQAHLFYFGCQLFSIDIKVQKGEKLLDMFQRYCIIVTGDCLPDTMKKEIRKLKHSVFMYNFYKGSQMWIFMHFHQMTIVVTLMLAILARSLFSFGYIIVCLIMIYENHKFFRPHQKNFRLQKVLKVWLRPYVFIDITLQLIYQIPLKFLHDGQDVRWSWQNIIGFQDIWSEDQNNVADVVARSILFMILKAFTYYFVTLQIQVFDSTAYKTYIKKDFRKFIDMADTKGMCIIWKFNNEKIEKIKQQSEEKRKMDEMLNNLKGVLKKFNNFISWQSAHNIDLEFGNTQNALQKQTTSGQQQNQMSMKTKTHDEANIFDDEEEITPLAAQVQQRKRTKTIASTFTKDLEDKKQNNKVISRIHIEDQKIPYTASDIQKAYGQSERSSNLHQISEDDEIFGKDDTEVLQKITRKLSVFVRFIIWAKKTLTEQIIFISSETHLKKVAFDMQAGKTNILTRYEKKILSDIRDLRRKKFIEDLNDIDMKEMKRVQDFSQFGKLLRAYFTLIIEIIVTYSDSICYIFMIISMMKNAGLISLLYPIVVFGYALMEEINPRKKIWYTIMIYTEVLILIKFLFQLSFWDAIYWDYQIQAFQDLLNGIHVGLQRKATNAFGEMLTYFLPEILILFAIMSHIQKEIMIGILYHKEGELESIEEALIRYLKNKSSRENSNRRLRSPQIQSMMVGGNREDDNILNVFEAPLRKDVKTFNKTFRKCNSFHISQFKPFDEYSDLSYEEVFYGLGDANEEFRMKGRAHSMVGKKELKKIYNEIEEQVFLEQGLKKGFVQRTYFNIQRLFYKNSYFNRLFPSIKEQKPGKDLYSVIAAFQFMICIFMIFFYTKMDADVTNISESLTYNQFSGHMVIALFLQIVIMIIDRYLYKSKTFISIQEKEKKKKQFDKTIAEPNPLANMDKNPIDGLNSSEKHQDRGKSFAQFLEQKTRIKNILVKQQKKSMVAGQNIYDDKSTSSEEEEQRKIERNIVLENTKITLAIVSKFYLQWFLLIGVHGFVFWYFPIMGNRKLQNHAYCVNDSITIKTDDTVACNEFGQNWALVVFYLLYCGYFWISCLQIRYGVPEMKKGNFMMNGYGQVNKISFKGFMAIPFLFELKTFVDWTFTRTALDVFQWIILSSTHAELFIAKCLQGQYRRRPLGTQQQWYFKVFIGAVGQLGIVLLIAGPLLLFSTYNPIQEPNPVTNALIKLNILIEPENSEAKNTINLFTNNYVTELSSLTQEQFDIMNFTSDVKTKSFDIELIQFVKMNNYADSSWGVSIPNRVSLRKEFENVVENTTKTQLSIQLQYEFDRVSTSASIATHSVVVSLRDPKMATVLQNFSNTFSLDCKSDPTQNNTIYIPPFFTGVHFLNDKEDALPLANDQYLKGLQVFYSCGDYWTVDQMIVGNDYYPESHYPNSNLTGIAFFTFSSKISPSYFKYSILTFYISIVLVVGKLIRGVLVIGGNRIFIYEIPNSEPLLLLCECIYIYRMRSQLDKEEQLYFTFVDIMRSPEMIKAITGTALKPKVKQS